MFQVDKFGLIKAIKNNLFVQILRWRQEKLGEREMKTIELNGFDYTNTFLLLYRLRTVLYNNMNKQVHDGDNIINMKWIV